MQEAITAIPFLRRHAEEAQLQIAGTLPLNCLLLAQQPDDPFIERRSVDLETSSDGNVKATSYKAYNLLRFSQNQFQFSVLKLLPAAAAVVSGHLALSTVLAVLGFIQTFLEGSQKAFQEQDARVLLAIYKLG